MGPRSTIMHLFQRWYLCTFLDCPPHWFQLAELQRQAPGPTRKPGSWQVILWKKGLHAVCAACFINNPLNSLLVIMVCPGTPTIPCVHAYDSHVVILGQCRSPSLLHNAYWAKELLASEMSQVCIWTQLISFTDMFCQTESEGYFQTIQTEIKNAFI